MYIILFAMGNSVTVARQTLTLFVGVRIPIPQPEKSSISLEMLLFCLCKIRIGIRTANVKNRTVKNSAVDLFYAVKVTPNIARIFLRNSIT